MDPHRRRHHHQQPPYEGPSGERYVRSPLRSLPDTFDDRIHPSPLRPFYPVLLPPPQNPPVNHLADAHHHRQYYQDPRRDDVRYIHFDKPHFALEVPCEPRRLEPMDYIPHQHPNPRVPDRASLPEPVRKRWPEQREVLPRELWHQDRAEEAVRVRVYDEKRAPFDWEEGEIAVSAVRTHGLQSFQRERHPRLVVESGGDPSPGRTRPRRDQVFSLRDDNAFLNMEGYEGRGQRKPELWGDFHGGGGGNRHRSRDAPYEPEPSEIPTLAPTRSGFPSDRYGEASSSAFNNARSPPLNPTESWILPGKRVQPVSEAYVVNHDDRGYWGNSSRVGKEIRTVSYSREERQDFVIPRKPSVLSRIQHSAPVWERLEEPNKVSSTIVRPERLEEHKERPERVEEHKVSTAVIPEMLEGQKLLSTIVRPCSPGFSGEDVTENLPVSLDVSFKANTLVAKEVPVSTVASEQNRGQRNDTLGVLTEEPIRKSSPCPQSNGTVIPTAGNSKRKRIKKSSEAYSLSIQTKDSSKAVVRTPKKKVVKRALSSNKNLRNSSKKTETVVSSQEEALSGGSNKDPSNYFADQILSKKDGQNNAVSISPISDVTDPVGKTSGIPFEEESSNEHLSDFAPDASKHMLDTDDMLSHSVIVSANEISTVGFLLKVGLDYGVAQPGKTNASLVSPIKSAVENKADDLKHLTPSTANGKPMPHMPPVKDLDGCSTPTVTLMRNCPEPVAASNDPNKLVSDENVMLHCKAASSGNKTSNLSLDVVESLKSSSYFSDAAPKPNTEGELAKDTNRSDLHDTDGSRVHANCLLASDEHNDLDKESPLTGCDGNSNSYIRMQIKRKRRKLNIANLETLVITNPPTEDLSQKATSTTYGMDSAEMETILVPPNKQRKRKEKRSNDCIVLTPSIRNTTKGTREELKLEDGHDKHISVASYQDVNYTKRDDNVAMLSGHGFDLKYSKLLDSLCNNSPQLLNEDKFSSLSFTCTELYESAKKTLAELSYPSIETNDTTKTCKATEVMRKESKPIQGTNVENPVCQDLGSLPEDIGNIAITTSAEAVMPFWKGNEDESVAAQMIESPCFHKENAASELKHHSNMEKFRFSSKFPCLIDSSASFQERSENDCTVEYKEHIKSVEKLSSHDILTEEVLLHGNDTNEKASDISKVSVVQGLITPLTEPTPPSVCARASSSSGFAKEHAQLDREAKDATPCFNFTNNNAETRKTTPSALEFERGSEPTSKLLKEMLDVQGDPLSHNESTSNPYISDEVITNTLADSNTTTSNMEIKPSGNLSSRLFSEKKTLLSNQEVKASKGGNSTVKSSVGNTRVPQKVGQPGIKHYQRALPVAAPPRAAPSLPQNMRHRTWHRADPPALQSVGHKKPQSRVSSSLQQELPNKPQRPLGSYVRKGNSLVRNSSVAPSQPSVSLGASCEKFGYPAAKSITSVIKSIGLIDRPKTPPLPLINSLSNGSSNLSNHDPPTKVNLEGTSQSNMKSQSDIDRELPGNFEINTLQSRKTKSKAVVYLKPKSNQLVATNEVETSNLSSHVLDNGKTQSSSDLYYTRKKNQLIRDTAAGCHLKKEGSASPDVSNQKGQAVPGIPSATYNNTVQKKYIYKGRSIKFSKFSRVWRLNATSQYEKGAARSKHIEDLTKFLPWKRPTSQWFSKNSSANKHPLDFISRKLRLSRKRDTIYTVSKGGYSLRKSGVRGIGGSNLKWSKSMEKHSRNANKELTMAVVEAEKKKRASLVGIGVKGRKCSSKERIFRVGKIRYRMDPSKKTLYRIPDEDPSTSDNQSGRSVLASRIPSRLLIGRDEYVRVGNGNKLVRDPKKLVRILASEKVRWSLHTARRRSAKRQQYCQFFTRFGKCKKMGKDCPYIHDPSKIAICTKYLKGVCSGVNCSLTHKIDPKMMPDCSYFLRGHCNKAMCPYRHVNVNPSATVCEGFQKGYCANGNECRKKHNFLCPVFEATGKCPQGSACKLHHPKHENKSKKRKRSDMRRPSKWRYFISSRAEVTQVENIDLGRHPGNKESEDEYSEGGTLEYMSLNFDGEDDSIEGLNTPDSDQVVLDADWSDVQHNCPDDLIKPVRIMNGYR